MSLLPACQRDFQSEASVSAGGRLGEELGKELGEELGEELGVGACTFFGSPGHLSDWQLTRGTTGRAHKERRVCSQTSAAACASAACARPAHLGIGLAPDERAFCLQCTMHTVQWAQNGRHPMLASCLLAASQTKRPFSRPNWGPNDFSSSPSPRQTHSVRPKMMIPTRRGNHSSNRRPPVAF